MIALMLTVPLVHAQQSPSTAEDTFGGALNALQQTVTWSAYADFALLASQDGSVTFDASHFNPILGARLSEKLYTELELEIEHAGQTIKMEYGFLDFRQGPPLTVRTGRFLVPIGIFNDQLHPSFRWPQVSRPLLTEQVLPAVWSDLGVQALGDIALAPGVVTSWTVFVVNGLGGAWEEGTAPPLRELRDNVLDNNNDKGAGGRLGISAAGGAGRVKLDLSAYTGALDDAGATRLGLLDGAIDAEAGPVTLRSEVVLSTLDHSAWRSGAYVLAGLRAGRLEPALRWDTVAERSGGGVESRGVVSLKVAMSSLWNIRAEAGTDLSASLQEGGELGMMSAFFF